MCVCVHVYVCVHVHTYVAGCLHSGIGRAVILCVSVIKTLVMYMRLSHTCVPPSQSVCVESFTADIQYDQLSIAAHDSLTIIQCTP